MVIPLSRQRNNTVCEFVPIWPPQYSQYSQYCTNPIDAYIDAQFRILREDCLSESRDSIQQFIYDNGLSRLAYNTNQTLVTHNRNQSTLLLYRNLTVKQLVPFF